MCELLSSHYLAYFESEGEQFEQKFDGKGGREDYVGHLQSSRIPGRLGMKLHEQTTIDNYFSRASKHTRTHTHALTFMASEMVLAKIKIIIKYSKYCDVTKAHTRY